MRKKRVVVFDRHAIRNWTLYVVRLTDDHYYIGITSRKDFMKRIRQHGTGMGAKVNRGRAVEEIMEVHDLGKITALEANNIENEMTLEYRKKFGARKVRGGYEIYKNTSVIPTYTPGSIQSFIFIGVCVLLAMVLLVAIAVSQN